MWTIALDVLKKIWWIIPMLGMGMVILFLRSEVQSKEAMIGKQAAQISQLKGQVQLQNAQIAAVKQAGEAAVQAAKAQVVERVKVEHQVQVKWQTRYVPVKVPETCEGAVAAGAVNGAQIGRLYMEGTP